MVQFMHNGGRVSSERLDPVTIPSIPLLDALIKIVLSTKPVGFENKDLWWAGPDLNPNGFESTVHRIVSQVFSVTKTD